MKEKNTENLMDKLISLCKRRGFIFPSSEIYGGIANGWDYGPLGAELKNNIKRAWWKRFVHGRDDMVGIDAALIMNPKIWEASGHLSHFTDPLVDCKKCKNRFRADEITPPTPPFVRGGKKDDFLERGRGGVCPNCGGELTQSRQFNMMLKTFLGPLEDESAVVYFRPETAQAMFVDFKQVLQTTRKKLPFGIAQAGKAFRNEITPGNFIFRTREFEQMEIEYFVKEKDWKKNFEMWLEEMKQWCKFLGLKDDELYFHEIADNERAHYSKRTIDIEYKYPFGQKELYGLAYRTDYDLQNHMKASGADLNYEDPATKEKFVPHVIEPTWGVDRSVLVTLLSAYHEEEAPTSEKGESETRVVLKIPKALVPIQVAVLPLSKKEELSNIAKNIAKDLREQFVVEYDETQSIGRRYRRQDEIGTPYCVTVDFDSLNDLAVTVRDRDTMKQERVQIAGLPEYFNKAF
ncbi:MAG: Glycine-tRNA ligase [Parcubacteria group bacterium GW2011_GWA2_38_13]|nr:MAG: Glycine-tRNA ligase [Parcubacteria group bacterium GW2011_GWA2_38_13]